MDNRKRSFSSLRKPEIGTSEIGLNVLPTYLPNSKRHQSNTLEDETNPNKSSSEPPQIIVSGVTNNPNSEDILPDQAEQHTNGEKRKHETSTQTSIHEFEKTKKSQDKVPVFGTNILLETEEDIKKWIQERKKNYPTNKKIQEKQEKQQSSSRPEYNSSVNSIKKARQKGANNNYSSFTKSNINSKTINLIPQSTNKNLQNGRVRDFQGIKVFIPSRFNNTFITSKEKKNFSNRLTARDNVDINNKILNFIEDLVENNVFDIMDAPEKIKNML